MKNKLPRPLKLVHIAAATTTVGDGGGFVRYVGIDENGRAWEYHAAQKKWTKLPELPENKEDHA
jgi:hypothetical protein